MDESGRAGFRGCRSPYRDLACGHLLARHGQVVELASMETPWIAPRRPGRCRALAALVLTIGVLLAPACTPEAKPFLWRIEAEPPSYLFGTVHVPDARVTTLPVIVRRSFRAADVLFTEIPLDETVDAQKLMSSGKSLRELLPENLYRRVSAYFQAHQTPMANIEPLAIWAVVFAMLQTEIAKLNGTGDVLDRMLWEHGVDQGKKLGGLASVEEQMGVFNRFTIEEQRVMLDGTLDLLEEQERTGKNLFEEMIQVYRLGEENRLQEFALQSSGFEGHEELERKFIRLIIDERNVQMADRIIAELKTEPTKSHFFAVGAMHFAGDESIQALLRAKGYQITRL